jgi:hypothetical protein
LEKEMLLKLEEKKLYTHKQHTTRIFYASARRGVRVCTASTRNTDVMMIAIANYEKKREEKNNKL